MHVYMGAPASLALKQFHGCIYTQGLIQGEESFPPPPRLIFQRSLPLLCYPHKPVYNHVGTHFHPKQLIPDMVGLLSAPVLYGTPAIYNYTLSVLQLLSHAVVQYSPVISYTQVVFS
jgi:hypothetical protein